MGTTADVIVVGGGIVGVSTAYALAIAGAGKVLLLEKGALAEGATGRSSALIRMHYTVEADARLAWASMPFWANWGDIIGGDCGFVSCGVLVLVGHDRAEHLQSNVAMMQKLGIDTRTITPDEALQAQPFLNVDDVGLAAVEPRGGYADPHAATVSLARRAAELGANIRQGQGVVGLRLEGGRVMGVETADGQVAASTVVLTAGAWTHSLCRKAGIELPLRSWGIQTAQVRRPQALQSPHMVILDRVLATYYRSETGGITLVGARYRRWEIEPDTVVQSIWPDDAVDAAERLVSRAPAMADAGLMGGYAHVDSYSPDEHAVIGLVPGVDGLYVAAGFSGSGFKIAPAVGMSLAELILNGESKTADLTPFRPTRFMEDRPLVGEHEYGDNRGSSSERPAV